MRSPIPSAPPRRRPGPAPCLRWGALALLLWASACTEATDGAAVDALGPSDAIRAGSSDAAAAAPDGTATEYDEKPAAAVFTEPIPSGEPITFGHHINLILKSYCGACHSADAEGSCIGYSCFVDHYEVTQLPGCCTPELPFRVCRSPDAEVVGTLGSCLLMRIEATLAGSDKGTLTGPGGTILLVPAETDAIRRWLEAGAPP